MTTAHSAGSTAAPAKKIGILVVAYNAATTLASVLDRIPRDFMPRISKIIVNDDYSNDSTYLVGLGYRHLQPDLPLEVIRHPRNLGYGGNQKAGFGSAGWVERASGSPPSSRRSRSTRCARRCWATCSAAAARARSTASWAPASACARST